MQSLAHIVERLRVHRINNHKDPASPSPSPYLDCATDCGHARKVA